MRASADHWKNALLDLPEKNLFDLLRNYLGPLSTPFNKQNLIEKLAAYLQRQDVLSSMLSLIEPLEASILSVLYYQPGLSQEHLYTFFSTDFNKQNFALKLTNLKERMLIFNISENGERIYHINPFLLETFRDTVISPLSLLEEKECEPLSSSAVLPWLDDSLLMAFCSFLIHTEVGSGSEHGLRKKDWNRFLELFSLALGNESSGIKLDLMLNAVEKSGLFHWETGLLNPRYPSFQALAGFPREERFFYLNGCAASGLSRFSKEDSFKILKSLYNFLPFDASYTRSGLCKIIPLISGISSLALGEQSIEMFLENVIQLGFLTETETGWFQKSPLPQHPEPTPGSITLHGNFDVTMLPEVPFHPRLSFLFSLERFDRVSSYRLNRSGIQNLLQENILLSDILKELEDLTDGELAQNISFSLQEWEKDIRGIRFYRGITLVADEEKRVLIDHTDHLTPYIMARPAPGVYILSEFQVRLWEEALKELGIESPIYIEDFQETSGFSPVPRQLPSIPELTMNMSRKNILPSSREKTLTHMEKLKERVIKLYKDDDIQIDFLERIERKVLFHEDQLKESLLRKEMSYARGVDFSGKLHLIEAAIASAVDRLDISFPSEDPLELEKESLIPIKVVKEDGEPVFYGRSIDTGKEFNIRVSKIAGVTKKRFSLI